MRIIALPLLLVFAIACGTEDAAGEGSGTTGHEGSAATTAPPSQDVTTDTGAPGTPSQETSGASGTGGTPTPEPTPPTPTPPDTCGDGVIDEGEECDEGPDNSDTEPDACRTDCTLPRCGDGVVNTGQDCDEGPDNSDHIPDRCRTDCTLPRCGDGVRDTGEQCDLGDAPEQEEAPSSAEGGEGSASATLANGIAGAWCDASCRIVPQAACPALDVRELEEDGEHTDAPFFSWEVDLFPSDATGEELPVPSPCDDPHGVTRSAATFFTVPESAEYLVRLVEPADADTVTLWLVRRCGAIAVACEDQLDPETSSQLPGGEVRIRSTHVAGEGLFVIAATDEGGPDRVRIRVSRGALAPTPDEAR